MAPWTYLVLYVCGLCISLSLQCTRTYKYLNITSNDTILLSNVSVRSMIECSVICANQNCTSFLFETQTKTCTTYSSDNHTETGNNETGDFTTSCKTNTMSRSYTGMIDCGDLCCTKCSGVYQITPVPGKSFDVFCDTETPGGPWTVIQRRFDGSVNFYRDWEDYKWGFGNLHGEYWLGLEYLYNLLILGQQLYIYLEGWDGTTGNVSYHKFVIENESSNYKLAIGEFSGNVEDRFTLHARRAFSTYDSDNDVSASRNCAEFGKGGWWYRNCYSVNLNGLYTEDQGLDVPNSMNWNYFYPNRRQAPLRKSSMMVKRKIIKGKNRSV